MENLINNQWKIFKGAGWLLGISLSIVSALVVFTLSDSFAAAISAALPIGVFAGISLEQKFQKENMQVDNKKTKMMISSLLFGFIIFFAIYIILHL
jgi:dipeptide/tripeptide permease